MFPRLGFVFKASFLFYFLRHIASFLSMFKLLVIGVIIIGKDPFALFGMQAPGIWEWGQGNKVGFSFSCVSECKGIESVLSEWCGCAFVLQVMSSDDSVWLCSNTVVYLRAQSSVRSIPWDFIIFWLRVFGLLLKYCFAQICYPPGLLTFQRLRGRMTIDG